MAASGDRAEENALWRRWCSLAEDRDEGVAEPEALWLAAYAEGRLDEIESENVERWLAAAPERIDDLAAARGASTLVPNDDVPEALIARACALVGPSDDRVLAFPTGRVRQPRSWRAAIAWSGLAASLLVASLVGFALGSNAYSELLSPPSSSAFDEILDPPSGLFTIFDEDSST